MIAATYQRSSQAGGSRVHANQREIAKSLGDEGALRSDLDFNRAADILWTLNHPDVWQLLVGQRGRTPEQYEHWFADAACSQLLAPVNRRAHQAPRASWEPPQNPPADGRSRQRAHLVLELVDQSPDSMCDLVAGPADVFDRLPGGVG